ncbi:MAG: hypothetical protein ACLP01_31315 [Solirubrobacteraceae bacterium]
MTQDDFNETWMPRIGEQAAARLRRNDSLILVIIPMCFVCGFALDALIGLSALFTLVFWIGALTVSVLLFGRWLWSRIMLAREISAWFDRKLSWHQLPKLRPSSFDRWCGRLGLQAPSERLEAPADNGAAGDVADEHAGEPGLASR